MSTDLTRV